MDASPKCIKRVANCVNHVANCVNHVPTSCIFRIITSCIFSVTSDVTQWPNIDLWPHAYSAWPLTSHPSRDLTSRCCEFATQLKQFATIDEIRSAIDPIRDNDNIDFKYCLGWVKVYSAIGISSVGDLFHCCVAKTQTWILNIDHGRPIESFWLDRVLSPGIVYEFFSAIVPWP